VGSPVTERTHQRGLGRQRPSRRYGRPERVVGPEAATTRLPLVTGWNLRPPLCPPGPRVCLVRLPGWVRDVTIGGQQQTRGRLGPRTSDDGGRSTCRTHRGGAAGHAPGRGSAGPAGPGGGGNQNSRRGRRHRLTLVHDDGPPRWVATTDAAMQLLEEVQHDFGEGPCLAAFAEDRVVAVQDLRTELVWDPDRGRGPAVAGAGGAECAGAAG
jgi:hypothetical protein